MTRLTDPDPPVGPVATDESDAKVPRWIHRPTRDRIYGEDVDRNRQTNAEPGDEPGPRLSIATP